MTNVPVKIAFFPFDPPYFMCAAIIKFQLLMSQLFLTFTSQNSAFLAYIWAPRFKSGTPYLIKILNKQKQIPISRFVHQLTGHRRKLMQIFVLALEFGSHTQYWSKIRFSWWVAISMSCCHFLSFIYTLNPHFNCLHRISIFPVSCKMLKNCQILWDFHNLESTHLWILSATAKLTY
jgi:hypothetical protein